MPAPTDYLLTHGGHRVEVTYKNVKNLRLRVLLGGRVVVSVPLGVPEHELRRFLDENHAWILRAQQRMRMAAPPQEQLVDGGRVQLWGAWREVVVAEPRGFFAERLRRGGTGQQRPVRVHEQQGHDEGSPRSPGERRHTLTFT